MRTLAPVYAFAFSCMGAAASPSVPPQAPAPAVQAAPASSPEPVADAGVESPAVAQAQAVLDAADSTGPAVCGALAVLAKGRGAAAIPSIAAKLGSKDAVVRRAAVDALGEIGGPKARAALQKQLDAENRPEIRAAIERAMAAATP